MNINSDDATLRLRSAGNMIEAMITRYTKHRAVELEQGIAADTCGAFPFEDCPYCGGREAKQGLAMLLSQRTAHGLNVALSTLANITPMACFLLLTGERTEGDEDCGKCFSCMSRKAAREIQEILL